MNRIMKVIMKGAVLTSLVIGLPSCATGKSIMSSETIVQTKVGSVGGQQENTLRVFKGIPYAEAPIGELRWKPPVAKALWNGVMQANEFGASCPQPGSPVPNIYSENIAPFSEDCLSLNIWMPENAKNAPVFVWIHGGALRNGSSKGSLYDGSKMAERGNIVVSINYRLGVLGYMAHPELSAESEHSVSGNYGTLDQIEALRWISKNIEAFGGDAGNVTIAGESAGALSVMYLMSSPQAHGLFSKAIAQSAYMVSSPELKRKALGQFSGEEWGGYLGKKLQAETLSALREMNAQDLVKGAAAAGFMPLGIVDGHVLPDQMVNIFDRGEQAQVPILTGFNSGEIRSLRILAPKRPAKSSTYEAEIRTRYLDLADEFLRLYPSNNMQESIWATTRDGLYSWTSERLVRNQTTLGHNSFLYLFDHGYPNADKADLHAFHGSELPYMFGTLSKTPKLWPKIPLNTAEADLSNAMLDYWSNFASTGVPTTANGPIWPAFGSEKAYMVFGDKPEAATKLMPGMFELHEEAVCRRLTSGEHPWNWNVGLASPILSRENTNCP